MPEDAEPFDLVRAIDDPAFAWTLFFVGEDQAEKLGDLGNHLTLSRDVGKHIPSGYAYWGLGPTLAWKRACDDANYVVMYQGIQQFGTHWAKIKPHIATAGGHCHYVSLGPGTGDKDFHILRSLIASDRDLCYLPVDMSAEMLRVAVRKAHTVQNLPKSHTLPVQMDFTSEANLTAFRAFLDRLLPNKPLFISLLGNTLANCRDDVEILRRIRRFMRPHDALLLELAWTQDCGTTFQYAAKEEYAASDSLRDFVGSALLQYTDLQISRDKIEFSAARDDTRHKIEIRVSYRNTNQDREVMLVSGQRFTLTAKESIRVYLSRKYDSDGIATVLKRAGLRLAGEDASNYQSPVNQAQFGSRLMVLLPDDLPEEKDRGTPTVFLSYSHKDRTAASWVENYLAQHGVNVSLDEEFRQQHRLIAEVSQSIHKATRFVICCSRSSLSSTWVAEELSQALYRDRQTGKRGVMLIDLDGFVVSGEFVSPHAAELRERISAQLLDSLSSEEKDRQMHRLVEAIREVSFDTR
jgi:uncharacterized SAM-dependent methyltransferase